MKSEVDLLTILTAGARLEPERSRALPQAAYGDPARFVRFESEMCGGCKFARIIPTGDQAGIGVCRVKLESGQFRKYGTRCEDFKLLSEK